MAETRYPFSSSLPHGDSDRLSNLSDDLLHKILSDFNLKELIQTSVLSKRWRYFWTILSSLNFHSDYLAAPSYKSFKFDDIVTQVLDHGCKNSNLNTLRIISNEYCEKSNIQSWIQIAVNRNVQILDIQLHQPSSKVIDLPPSLCTCQSLKFLELVLNMYAKGEAICLPVDKVFSGCPVLEMLVITNFTFDESQSLVITSNVLKRLVILMGCDGYGVRKCEITVDAPNLLSFKCIDWSSNNYHIKDVSSLEIMYLDNAVRPVCDFSTVQDANKYVKWLQEICRVKSLTLAPYILAVVARYVDIFHRAPISFGNLNYLSVTITIIEVYLAAVKWILRNSPNIETLIIKNDSRFISNEISDEWGDSLSFKNLKCVELHFVGGFNNEPGLLKGLLKNAMELEEITIVPATYLSINKVEFFTTNLFNLPRAFAPVKISFRKSEH